MVIINDGERKTKAHRFALSAQKEIENKTVRTNGVEFIIRRVLTTPRRWGGVCEILFHSQFIKFYVPNV